MIRRSVIVRRIWAVCLLLAGVNHARILLTHGIAWDYHGAPWPSALYWSALTVLDPLVALLLLTRPRTGVPATVLLIGSNVLHNLAATVRWSPVDDAIRHIVTTWQLMAQIGFLAFVLATWRMVSTDLQRLVKTP